MKNYLYFIGFLTLFISCNKEEDLPDNQLLASLEGKTWVVSQVILDSVDITSSFDACELDNERIFYLDNTYELTEGDTTCTEKPDVTATGTWHFNDVKTTLKIAIGTDTSEYIIRELYKNQMRVFFIDQSSGGNYTWTLITK